jgi:type VI secretion system protein VasJ
MSFNSAVGSSTQSSLLDAFCAPLRQGGEDLRYCEEFLLAKREIDKFKGNDYDRAQKICGDLLACQGKDLRVAGFLLMAALGRDGLPGLLEAAEGYRYLLERFWDECHPRKESARLSAIAILNGSRFETMAREAGHSAALEDLACLRSHVDAINATLRSHLGKDAPQWRALDPWLKIKQPVEPVALPEKTAEQATPESSRALTENLSVDSPDLLRELSVSSEREAFDLTFRLSTYCREQGNWPQALAFTRALRWGALDLPPHEQGRTRVPAPRDGAVTALENQRQAEDPAALLQLCESLFLEPGGQFWLDLQYLSRQAANTAGLNDLQAFLDGQAGLLLRRLPDLAILCFEDGRPFADFATRAWLDELCREEIAQIAATTEDDWEGQFSTTLKQARELAAHKKLLEGLNLLRSLPVPNQTRRLRLELAQAGLCLQGSRLDIALPLVESLEEQVDTQRVALWDEALALEIWRFALDTRQQCVCKASAEEKAALETRTRQLRSQICRTNPAMAVQWL